VTTQGLLFQSRISRPDFEVGSLKASSDNPCKKCLENGRFSMARQPDFQYSTTSNVLFLFVVFILDETRVRTDQSFADVVCLLFAYKDIEYHDFQGLGEDLAMK